MNPKVEKYLALTKEFMTCADSFKTDNLMCELDSVWHSLTTSERIEWEIVKKKEIYDAAMKAPKPRRKNYLAFTLSMPNVGSWDGKWSGQGREYVRTRQFSKSKAGAERMNRALAKDYYYYNFGDGWGAGVSVKAVDSVEARKLNIKSAGFCGYEWMIDSILEHGDIRVVEKPKIVHVSTELDPNETLAKYQSVV